MWKQIKQCTLITLILQRQPLSSVCYQTHQNVRKHSVNSFVHISTQQKHRTVLMQMIDNRAKLEQTTSRGLVPY